MKLREFTNDATEALLKNRHNVDRKNIAVVNLSYSTMTKDFQTLTTTININHTPNSFSFLTKPLPAKTSH